MPSDREPRPPYRGRLWVRAVLLAALGVTAGLWVTRTLEEAVVDEHEAMVRPAERESEPGSPPAGPDPQALAEARLDAATTRLVRRARPSKPRGARSDSLQALGRSLGAKGAPVSDPCVRFVGGDCVQTALSPLFSALEQAEAGEGQARVAVFGNSLIASDRIINIWRDRFQERFGDAGRGFLLADRMAPYGGRSRTGVYARGLETYNIAQGPFGPWPHGAPGVLHFSSGVARTTWWTKGARRARLFWLDHEKAPALEVQIDDEPVKTVPPNKSGKGRVLELVIPEEAKALRLRVPRGRAVLYGVSLEKADPGVIIDTFGVVASDSTLFLKEDEALFAQQLGSLEPDLVTVMLGGNETKRVAWGKSDLHEVRADLHGFLQRIKRVAPRAGCLVVGPIENVRGKSRSRSWDPRWQLYVVNRLMKEVALAEGCAHLDLFEAMGGKGQLKRLNARNLLHDDMVHPKGRGLDLPGELVSDALLDAYEKGGLPSDEGEALAKWAGAAAGVTNGYLTAFAKALPPAKGRPVRVALLPAADEEERRLLRSLVEHLERRFGAAGTGLRAPEGEIPDPSGSVFLDVWSAGPEPAAITSRGRALEPQSAEALGGGLRRTRFDVELKGGLALAKGSAPVLAYEAHGRYAGLVVDRLTGALLPTAVLGERAYDLVLGPASAAGRAAELVTERSTTCLLWGAGPSTDECAALDPFELTGGEALWRERGLLGANGTMTDAGREAAVTVALATLLEPVERAARAREDG